jgi:predicted dienelactone hydrolase
VGDNYQDRSLVTSGRYFSERPRQLTRVLDALLASPEWGARIPADRIGAVGHSAGGYSVLALAGGQAEPQRAAQHFRTVLDDPVSALWQRPRPARSPPGSKTHAPAAPRRRCHRRSLPDRRIRAVVALAPMAVVFTSESLAAIKVPVRVMMAERDAVLKDALINRGF